MDDGTRRKSCDCVQWTRNVRDRMYEETKHMSPEERLDWQRSQRPADPILARMWDNAKPPRSARGLDRGTDRLDGPDDTQVVIEITQNDTTGHYTASALESRIRAQGDSLDEIRANVKQAVNRYLDATAPADRPKYICLRFLRDEVIPA